MQLQCGLRARGESCDKGESERLMRAIGQVIIEMSYLLDPSS